MAEETLYCPSCNRKVRVPEELLGQPVQCPLCRLVFTAPLRGQSSVPMVRPAPEQPGGPVPVLRPDSPWPQEDSSAARAAVRGPAIGLLIVGVLGLITTTVNVVRVGLLVFRGTDEALDALFPPGLEMYRQAMTPEMVTMALIMALIVDSGCLLISVLVCQAGTQMLRLRSYRLAVVASFLAMLNIESCCCLLGLPIGIWSLVVLFRPGIRDSFQ